MRTAIGERPCFSERTATLPPGVIALRARRLGVLLRRQVVEQEAEAHHVRAERVEQLGVRVDDVLEGDGRRPAGRAVVHDDGEDRRELLRARSLRRPARWNRHAPGRTRAPRRRPRAMPSTLSTPEGRSSMLEPSSWMTYLTISFVLRGDASARH
jgi:hypothetical protein